MTTESLPATYRAYVIEAFGDAVKNIKLRSGFKHAPLTPTQVRIKVHAAAVNPVDFKMVELGAQFLESHPTTEDPLRFGFDVAGVVVEAGKDVTRFKVGDEVYAMSNYGVLGAHAEYYELDVKYIAHKPKNLTFREAVGLPLVGLTSYQALSFYGKLKAGDRVLILGGSSGTGTVGVQIAKALGASFVAATTSSRNLEFVKSLGADQIMDYTSEKWWEVLDPHSIDLIYDCGAEPLSCNDVAQKVLKPDTGVFVTIDAFAPIDKAILGPKIHQIMVDPNFTDLETLTKLAEAGKLTVPIDSVYKFESLHDAITKQKSNRVRGVVVETGEDVEDAKVGDEVYAMAKIGHMGSFAEYFEQDVQFITHKPKNLSFSEAVGLPSVGITSYQALEMYGKVKPGDRVVILGGSCGTGAVAVQVAKALGASFVATTTSSHTSDFVKSMCVDQVIDHSSQKWWEELEPHSIDLIFDCGFEPLTWNDVAQKVLKPHTGTFVTIDPSRRSMNRPTVLTSISL
ncbi:hypothetical protein Poli38472_009998 [Pythium oligandrum]|uniref:Enoyl reductase (ER) domain-containing protein n=1 Tax=Pythium oligandrum TaxID=41045 RepID=A0A8K1FEY4_PYTOL|nr:hypothetical protein Poli38472_009998 [Pythium oligandrum]|eukprot:TMW58439.1 hypothetical protein Poli38472_009998 [Pythium oligandrum]